MEAFAIFLQARRRVRFGVDADRDEKHIFAEASADSFLHLFKVAIHRRADAGARCEEGVDGDDLVLEHVRVEAQFPSILIDQLDVGKVFLCG